MPTSAPNQSDFDLVRNMLYRSGAYDHVRQFEVRGELRWIIVARLDGRGENTAMVHFVFSTDGLFQSIEMPHQLHESR